MSDFWGATERQRTAIPGILEVRPGPHVSDDAWFYAEQFARWLAEPLADCLGQEVDGLNAGIPAII